MLFSRCNATSDQWTQLNVSCKKSIFRDSKSNTVAVKSMLDLEGKTGEKRQEVMEEVLVVEVL